MNSNDIKRIQLEKNAFGFKADSVNQFISDVYNYTKDLEEQNAVLEKKMAVLAKKIEEYRSDETNMKEALVGAQRLGQTVVNDANEKAATVVAEANIKAEAILREAENEASKRAKALKVQVASEEKELLRIKKEVSEFKSKLLTIYKSHLDVITALPEVEPEEDDENEVIDTVEEENNTVEEETESVADEEQEQSADSVDELSSDITSEKSVPSDIHEELDEEENNAKEQFTARFGELKFGKNFRE